MTTQDIIQTLEGMVHNRMAFTPVMQPKMWSVGIAEKGTRGFTPTNFFLSMDRSEAEKQCEEINNHFFPERTLRENAMIVLETMAA